MLKRELKFSSYLLPLVMVSLFPSTGAARDQIPLIPSDPLTTQIELQPIDDLPIAERIVTPAAAPVSQPATPAPASVAATPPAAPAVQPPGARVIDGVTYVPAPIVPKDDPAHVEAKQQPEVPGMLDHAELSELIKGGVSIKIRGKEATLEGWIPDACRTMISVHTTSDAYPNLSSTTGSVKSVGFAVHNNGGFIACMKKPENNCDNENIACHQMSDTKDARAIEIPFKLDGQGHYKLAYLNDRRTTGVHPVDVKVDGGSAEIKSDSEIASENEARLNATNAKIEDTNFKLISNCVKKATDVDALESLKALVTDGNKLSDPGHRQTIIDKIMAEEKSRESKEVVSLKNEVKALRKKADNSKTTVADIDDIKTSVYELSDKLSEKNNTDPKQISDKEYTVQQDVLAGIIQKLIEIRVSDDPNAEAFEDAKAMLDEALSGASSSSSKKDKDDEDSDEGDGTGLHPSKKALKELEAIYPILRRAKVSTSLMTCMEDEYQLGGRKPTSATRDCKEASKEFESETKALEKDYKGCLDKNGDDSKKRQKDKDFAAQCKETEDEFQALQEVPSVDQAAIKNEYQSAVAKAQKARTGTGLASVQQQNQNTLAGLTFAGSPQTPTFATGGIPTVYGAANGLGVNQYAYAPGMAQMNGLTYNPSMSPLAQTNPFNGYLLH